MADEALNELFYGSMLHDIGKIVQRATNERVRHSKLGADYLRKFTDNRTILHQVMYHHVQELQKSSIPDDDFSYITYIADNIASGFDRRDNNEEIQGHQWDKKANLEDIFNRFGAHPVKRFIQPAMLGEDMDDVFPQDKKLDFTAGDYSGIMRKITDTLSVMNFDDDYRQSLLNLFESTASFIPSSTNTMEVADVSLYDHMRLTAGLATSIFLYLKDSGITNYKDELYKHSLNFYQKEAFRLVSFDISGIQDFIYTITSAGAHKQLRSRSFYLDMISEWIVDSLLNSLDLTRANVIYSGGGHAYIILPNTTEAEEKIAAIEQKFNEFFLKHFNTKLFVAFGSVAYKADDFKGGVTEDFEPLFRKVSQQISEKKLSRYDAATILKLNAQGKKSGRECAICHTVDDLLENDNKCHLCARLEAFSSDIQREKYFLVDDNADGLPVGPNKYLHAISEEQIKDGQFEGFIYSKNTFNTGYKQATRLLIGDYAYFASNELKLYSDRQWSVDNKNKVVGIKKIAALRCDVDDLGYAFMKGFSEQNDGIYNTFSRTATFSRRMSMFFKAYINQFSEDQHVMIIYSGGDDVFILGAWDDVLDFAVNFREKFKRWTGNKLTMSAGIGMFDAKTPINIIARETGKLEDEAKDNGKDSITLFETSNTFKWDDFISNVYLAKLDVIRNFFEVQNQHGKAFIYNLIELIRSRDENDKIAFARIAYTLARIEEDVRKNNAEAMNDYLEFKNNMMNWFNDSDQIKQAELALMLYVYEIRED